MSTTAHLSRAPPLASAAPLLPVLPNMCFNAVTVFAAIHVNVLLKAAVSRDDDHSGVILTTVGLFFIVYFATISLLIRCTGRPRILYTIGHLGGHIMGFSTKQIYIAAVRSATRQINGLSLGGVYLSILLLAAYVLVFHRIFGCVSDARKRCLGGSGHFHHLMYYRRRAVTVEAIEDAFAVALGYALFAAYAGTATFMYPVSLQSLFEAEAPCYRSYEESSDSPADHAGHNHNSSSGSEASGHQEDHSSQMGITYNLRELWFFTMMAVFPVVAYLLRQKGKQTMIRI